MPVSESASSA